ncbi:unnamed protein product, partial [Staurois parvus]
AWVRRPQEGRLLGRRHRDIRLSDSYRFLRLDNGHRSIRLNDGHRSIRLDRIIRMGSGAPAPDHQAG